ncbi:MAG: hypothetical protein HWD83_08955 [Gammaproteobacteria bacterium]|nr:hypothetical protein [Gammaproteobacteria bacterium]
MDAWGNYWEKGHKTTFGEYFANGYSRGYIHDWLVNIVGDATAVLEVGCGNASSLQVLIEAGFSGQYVGVDAAAASIPTDLRVPDSINARIISRTPIESFSDGDISPDLALSIYGLEYSDLTKSIPLLFKRIASNGRLAALVHHAGSEISEMSKKAVGEFDYDTIKIGVECLRAIDTELNVVDGDPSKLTGSAKANEARDKINDLISSVVNVDESDRNAILVDFCQQVLRYFKILRQDSASRAQYIDAIMPDFQASEERFKQMLSVAKTEEDAKSLVDRLTEAGFGQVSLREVEFKGRAVAWEISALKS